MYPKMTNAAVWKKNSKAIWVICPAKAIKPITRVQNPRTRYIRGIDAPPLYNAMMLTVYLLPDIIPLGCHKVNDVTVTESVTFPKRVLYFAEVHMDV